MLALQSSLEVHRKAYPRRIEPKTIQYITLKSGSEAIFMSFIFYSLMSTQDEPSRGDGQVPHLPALWSIFVKSGGV